MSILGALDNAVDIADANRAEAAVFPIRADYNNAVLEAQHLAQESEALAQHETALRAHLDAQSDYMLSAVAFIYSRQSAHQAATEHLFGMPSTHCSLSGPQRRILAGLFARLCERAMNKVAQGIDPRRIPAYARQALSVRPHVAPLHKLGAEAWLRGHSVQTLSENVSGGAFKDAAQVDGAGHSALDELIAESYLAAAPQGWAGVR